MDTTLVIGVLGAGLLLVAFVLNQFRMLDRESLTYDALNFVGGALLVWYAILLQSIPFLVLEGVWAIVSLRDVLLRLARKGENG